jgi:7-cyano-7-deazaguanine synthase in queuosine biosynthesis
MCMVFIHFLSQRYNRARNMLFLVTAWMYHKQAGAGALIAEVLCRNKKKVIPGKFEKTQNYWRT